MHPALECDDIFRAICLALREPEWPETRLQTGTLAALATTCKVLSEPALDVIWEELLEADHFLGLFPQGLFVMSERRLARPIMPIDWGRPRLYAPRVKKLSLYSDWGWAEVLKVMGLFYPSGGLLPNLRYLNCAWDADVTPLRVVLHSQLKEFRSSFPLTINNLSVLSALPVLCPHLTGVDLRLEATNDCPEAAAVISSLLSAREALQSLRLEIFMHIGALNLNLSPNLTTLSLGGVTELVNIAGSFPRLRHLNMDDVDPASVIKLFRSVTDVDLVNINMRLPSTASHQMTELVRALKSVASPTSLKTLSLQPATGKPAYVMAADTLRELSFFCRLKSVRINWTFGPDLDDATLDILTASWTQLTDLELYQAQADTNLTLKSLLALARNCPRLQGLSLQLDTREVPELPPVVRQRTLTTMRVGSSPIQNATKVARYISGIFPDVKYIKSRRSGRFYEHNPLWDQVLELLPEFAGARNEEMEKQKRMDG